MSARPGDFSSVAPRQEAGQGRGLVPGSNTGPKGVEGRDCSTLTAPLIDFLTVVLKPGALEKSGQRSWRELLSWLFELGDRVAMGSIVKRSWQFYDEHAVLIDRTNSVCGKVGWAVSERHARRGSVCISLSGAATRHMPQDASARWRLRERLALLGAKISRIDIAVDDLEGRAIDVHGMRQAYADGDFTSNGRPPHARFISDEGSGKGCTLYIGQKGHKELCIYEKGKQLGNPASAYTRCELRLYGSKVEIPLEVLLELEEHFAGAYPLLAEFVIEEAIKLIAKEVVVDCSVEGWKRSMRQQSGTGLGLAYRALGEGKFMELVRTLERPGVPGRFKKIDGDIAQLLRESMERQNEEQDHG